MVLIRDIVQQVLKTHYLSIEAENQLRQLLGTKYDLEDLNAHSFSDLFEQSVNLYLSKK